MTPTIYLHVAANLYDKPFAVVQLSVSEARAVFVELRHALIEIDRKPHMEQKLVHCLVPEKQMLYAR